MRKSQSTIRGRSVGWILNPYVRQQFANGCPKCVLVVRIGIERLDVDKRKLVPQPSSSPRDVSNIGSIAEIIDPEANLVVIAPIAPPGRSVSHRCHQMTREHVQLRPPAFAPARPGSVKKDEGSTTRRRCATMHR